MYPFTPDPAEHAHRFADVLAEELRQPWQGRPERAVEQQRFARETYDWPVVLAKWRALIGAVARERALAPATTVPIAASPTADRTAAALIALRERGFAPAAIIDAGAYRGDLSRTLRGIFPEAYILMIDALPEQEPALAQACREIGNADHLIALLGEQDADAMPFFVADTEARPDLVKTGSSKYRENTAFPMQERRMAQRRLDTLLAAHERAFSLIKLDLQGAELDALCGLGDRLATVEAILTEISLVPYNAGAPLMPEVLSTLENLGFALHDIVDELRHTDGSLLQVDSLFVRQMSRFRPQPPFWG